MNLDIAMAVNATFVAVLVGVGKTLWNANTSLINLNARLEAHLNGHAAQVRDEIRGRAA